jgi:cytochrome c553
MSHERTWMIALALLGATAAGCGEEVGPCDAPIDGEDTVLFNSTVQFGGQAIMNKACAGCHSSGAKGKARGGAPAGLDFDLYPVDPDSAEVVESGVSTNDAGQPIIKLKRAGWSGLRERQRRIFEERNLIWQQVKDGLMPPPDRSVFGQLQSIVGTSNRQPCQMDVGAYSNLSEKSSRDVLRKWLACGAPIVEINSDKIAADKDNASYPDAGFTPSAGIVGYQYLSCDGSDGGTGSVITFEDVYEKIIATSCLDCHSQSGQQTPNLDGVDKAHTALVGDKNAHCNGKPYVKAGDSAQSYLYELVSQTPNCSNMTRMPTIPLSSADQKMIADWIKGGALRRSDVPKSSVSNVSGMDAGVPTP